MQQVILAAQLNSYHILLKVLTQLMLKKKNDLRPAAYRFLDALRGFAALWVLMIHAVSTVITDPNAALARQPLYAFSFWGQLGVVMFFVISGYCITIAADNILHKQKHIFSFLKARLRRIYPPYFASIILVILLTTSFAFIAKLELIPKINHSSGNSLHQPFIFYFSSLTLTQVPFHVRPIQEIYWSLCYEVAFYFLVAICIVLSRMVRCKLYYLLNTVTLISIVWLILSPRTCPFPLNLWYQFGLGTLVYMCINQPKDLTIKIFLGITVALVIVFALMHQGKHFLGHPSSRTQAIFCLSFSFFLLVCYRKDSVLIKNPVIKGMMWLGTFSYSIYLSHSIIMSIPRQLTIKMGFINDTYWVSFIVQIIIAIGFAYIFHIICERPFMSSQAKVREKKVYLGDVNINV